MKISIVGTVGVPACYGGFETLVGNLLCESDQEQKITVYCSSKAYSKKRLKYKNAYLVYIPLNANGVQSIPYDILSLLHAAFIRKSENLLVLGVSGAICLPFIRYLVKLKLLLTLMV